MAESLIKPEVAKPTGIPPKKLIIGVFVGIALAALVLSFLNQPAEHVNTGDGVARENAAKLTDAERSGVGAATALVREESEKNGLPASFKPAPAASAASSTAMASNPYATTATTAAAPLPSGLKPAPLGTPGAERGDSAGTLEAARQVEAINSRMVVLDSEDTVAAGAKKAVTGAYSDLDRQIADAGRAAAAASGGAVAGTGDSIAANLAALAGAAPPAVSGRARDSKFLQEFADQRAKAALRPSAPEAGKVVQEGSVIPAVLDRDIVSDLPGVVTAHVVQDVYDSRTAQHRLICKGAKFVGRYNSEVREGQSRLLFAFTRLILPNGQSFDLGGFDGSDQAGQAGVTGDVNRHFWRIFGSSLAIGLLADRVTKSSALPQGNYASISATGQVMVDTAKQMLERSRDVAPTITIERGSRINVEVKRDMLFPSSTDASCK